MVVGREWCKLVYNYLSLFLVVFCWKPYYLFRKALKQRLKLYIIMYVKHLSVAIVSIILTYSVLKLVPMHSFESALSSFVYGVFITILYTLILLSMFYFLGLGLNRFIRRIQSMMNGRK